MRCAREYLVTSKRLLWLRPFSPDVKPCPIQNFLDRHPANTRTQTTREFGRVFPPTDVVQELA